MTLVPPSWTPYKIKHEFGCKLSFAHESKTLKDTYGIMPSKVIRASVKQISSENAELVKEFYYSSKVSRTMPGLKDAVTIVENGVRVRKQKLLLLMNLAEAYALFKEENPNLKVCFNTT